MLWLMFSFGVFCLVYGAVMLCIASKDEKKKFFKAVDDLARKGK